MRTSSFTMHPSDAQHLARLSKEHAEILALFRENSHYESIAATLAVPEGTVKSRLNRARAAIVKMRAQVAKTAEAA
jgi:DNA-directed RNA polymerase specialized sigma24 family protein